MTKTEAYAIRNSSRRLICAFVVGTLTAVLLSAVYALSRIPGLGQVPICLFWLSVFALVFRFRTILRRQSVWILIGLLILESCFVAMRGFDVTAILRRDRLYEDLACAVRENQVPEIKRILLHDPTPDYVPQKLPFCNSDQACYYEKEQRPIDIAIDRNNLPVAQLLADHGATVGPRGDDALEAAAKRGDLSMLRFLLDHGVLVNAPSGDSAALRSAVDSDQTAAVSLLLDAGANPNSRSVRDGHAQAASVLGIAQDANLRNIVLLLRQAGATE